MGSGTLQKTNVTKHRLLLCLKIPVQTPPCEAQTVASRNTADSSGPGLIWEGLMQIKKCPLETMDV